MIKKMLELFHYGVKGQQWGVRRYQNLDKSLTDEGRRHYGKLARESDARLMSRIKDKNDTEGKRSLKREIHKKSGNWATGQAISAGFKNEQNRHAEALKFIREKFDIAGKLRMANARRDQVMETLYKDKYGVDIDDSRFDKSKFKQIYEEAKKDLEYLRLKKEHAEASKKQRKETKEETLRNAEYLASVILQDLGYEDTITARKFLMDQGLIFED